jgi:threonine synthase
VPTGNFGNIYAGYVAASMGVPVKKLLIGTNSNDILFRFLESGTMKTETVIPTTSPSMDIQISSNFERVLFDLYGRDGEAVTGTMKYFRSKGPFALDESMMMRLRETFAAYRFDDAATKDIMRHLHNQSGYIADPHSAIGIGAAQNYMRAAPLSEQDAVVVLATAHPAKFPEAVEEATGHFPPLPARLAGLYRQEERLTVLPNDLHALKSFIREQP